MILVHVLQALGGVGRDGVGPGCGPLRAAHPRHATVAADVTCRGHHERPEAEILEAVVVAGIREALQESSADALALRCCHGDGLPDENHSAVGQRIAGVRFRHQQRSAAVRLQILGVLCQRADQKHGPLSVEAEGDQ
jgi:hypothetical protein